MNRNSHDFFNKALRRASWNTTPQEAIVIPSSINAVENAAKAIAICAYPQTSQLRIGGKAHKYANALVAYMFRVSQWVGELDELPPLARKIKAEWMWDRLETGHENLMRSFVIRDLISSALNIKTQNDAAARGERTTFSLQYSADLQSVKIEIPVQSRDGKLQLVGKMPSKSRASLREAVKKHKIALLPFAGVSPRIEGLDEEYFYQNTLNRFIRPTLQTGHILQIVWEAATKFRNEGAKRKLPIDQILMRKAVWADNIQRRAADNAGVAILNMRELGVGACACKLVHFGDPLPNS